MSQRIHVGNLSYQSSQQDLQTLFAEFGEVVSIAVPTDRETGQARGFAFVEMASDAADKAIGALNGKDFQGRALAVSVAKPRNEATLTR